MAWTDLSPYALAQVLTCGSDMNEIRLNLAETAPAIATAAGQLFYADGANSLDVLGISNNSILRAGASAPRWDGLLRTAVSDLTDNSQDDNVPTFGALRETFLPVAGLYTRFTSAGQAMSPLGRQSTSICPPVRLSPITAGFWRRRAQTIWTWGPPFGRQSARFRCKVAM